MTNTVPYIMSGAHVTLDPMFHLLQDTWGAVVVRRTDNSMNPSGARPVQQFRDDWLRDARPTGLAFASESAHLLRGPERVVELGLVHPLRGPHPVLDGAGNVVVVQAGAPTPQDTTPPQPRTSGLAPT